MIDLNRTIGSSEVYELLERPQYGKGCKRALAYRKLNYPADFPVDYDDPILKRGNRLESVAAEIYEQITGRFLRRVKPRLHRKFAWARASTDRLIATQHNEWIGDLEIKTRGEGPYYRVLRQGPFDGDELQIQWSMWCSGHKWGSLAVLGVHTSLPMLTWDREPDKELQAIFEQEGAKFAETVFERHELPEPTFPASDSRCRVCAYRLQCRGEEVDPTELEVQKRINASGRQLFQIDNPELATTLHDLDQLKQEAKALEDSIDTAKDKAVEQMGEGIEGAWVTGFGKVLHFPVRAHYIDSKRLKADLPDVFEKYSTERESYQFRIYPEGVRHGRND